MKFCSVAADCFKVIRKVHIFLAHLSHKLIWWAYRVGRPPSYVVVCRRPHSLNIFSSETTEPIKVKFHMELLWGMKVCTNGPGHMTKMATIPIYGKNKKNLLQNQKAYDLVSWYASSNTTNFAQIKTLGWPWHILRRGQIWSLMLLYGEKGKTVDFSRTIVVYDLKLATDDRSDKKFPLTSKLCPLGLYAPCPRAIYMY